MAFRTTSLIASLVALGTWMGEARAQTQVKPYFVVIVDNSGSMTDPTGAGTNTCGQERTRMSDAKCSLQQVVNAYGDVIFALMRFRIDSVDPAHNDPTLACPDEASWIECQEQDPDEGTCPATCINCQFNSINCNGCNNDGSGCPGGGASANRGQLLVELGDENQAAIIEWVDYSVNTCGASGTGSLNPELAADTWTPLGGALLGAQRYYLGNDPDFTSAEPIRSDPFRGCRPYYVILLTDGEETCASDAATVAGATALRNTVVDGVSYDIRTYAIGFDLDATATMKLNAVASAGGTGTAYLATNEATLSLAFSQIIEDSILTEVCDGIDNDCDGLIDEGFSVGTPCDGGDGDLCDEGVLECTSPTTVGCNDPAGETDVEVCNMLDDDCDGLIDEPPAFCPPCTLEPEICDNMDNNCNGMTDEGLSRPCGIDVGDCTVGTETCVAGAWVGCTGIGPQPETCNNEDDDCDGVTDGFAQDCGSTGMCMPSVPCQCQAGQQTCTAGMFGECVGVIGPGVEGCDGIDNDCDGSVDEDVPGLGDPCVTACGAGVTMCVMGTVTCVGGMMGQPEVCNNIDDDCDGMVDEGLPDMGPCTVNDMGMMLCMPGLLQCEGGMYHCVGGTLPDTEICDCNDNDCDGETDEGDLCAPGATCLPGPHCQCAQPCGLGEFPCPEGYRCTGTDEPPAGFCVVDTCFNVNCFPNDLGEKTVCVDGDCVRACDVVTCPAPFVCRPSDGVCVEDNCNGFPERCEAGTFCVDGVCEPNPCAGVTCVSPEYCFGGECVGSCAGIVCGPGQSCRLGECVDDPCAGVSCPPTFVCDPASATCIHDMCLGASCPPGETCDPLSGDCVFDPCNGVICPTGQVCTLGTCDLPATPDGGPQMLIVAAGGGGCACDVGQRRTPGPPLLMSLLALAALLCLIRGRR